MLTVYTLIQMNENNIQMTCVTHRICFKFNICDVPKCEKEGVSVTALLCYSISEVPWLRR